MKTTTSYESKKTGYFLFIFAFLILSNFNPLLTNAQTYSGPIVITKGGTYSGNWESRDSEIPAVDIRTSEPVIIENSNIRGAGYLIKNWSPRANVTVRHSRGYGLTPTPWKDYKKPRRFITVGEFVNVVVENNYLENTAGIYVAVAYVGNNTTQNTIKIRYNKVKNIDARIYGGTDKVQFVQFNYRSTVKNVEIAWNEIINNPNNSLVEENINIYNSKGAPDSPIRIHNNFIKGAYPIPANSNSYHGGGILSDSDADANHATSHLEAYENHLVNLGNHSMGIAGGNNIRYHHNRAINSATYADGTRFNFSTSGLWSTDYYSKGATFNNSIDNNEVAITAWNWPGDRNDWIENHWAAYVNNIHLPGPVTLQTEADEYTRFQQKLSRNGIVIGPNGSGGGTTEITPTTSVSGPTGTGKITREYWANVQGNSVTDVPVTKAPNSTSELTLFEAPSNVGDSYGQRVRGYVTAPVSGQYTFWIASDDHSDLYLSTSEDPAQKKRIAYINGWSNSQEWSKHASQKSASVYLEAGKRYYIEALMLEGGGGDNLAVGWQLPNGALERPIAGNRLSPVTTSTLTYTPVASTTTATGKITLDYWSNVFGSSPAAIPTDKAPNRTTEITSFNAPSGQGNNYGQRVRGYVTAPVSGQYTFWIAADDMAELYLSTSENPAHKSKIAYSTSWTGAMEWTRHSTQQSAKITLEAGKRYYIEALMLQGGGGDNLAVGWQLPNGALERPIGGNRLAPMGSTAGSTEITPIASTSLSTGKITREYWANVQGNSAADVPVTKTPNNTSELTLFESPSNVGDGYGQRVRGYVTAPVTGQYTFWLASDDHSELYLSTSENPANKTKIAYINGWANSREWHKHGTQQSQKITLEAGKRYYIEAVMLEIWGGDNLAVGWQLPNGTLERPIAGNRLSPMGVSNTSNALAASTEKTEIKFTEATAYPNPFNDVIMLDLGQEKTELAEVVIFDQVGREAFRVQKPELSNNKLEINLADAKLSAGMYIIKYTDTEGKVNSIKTIKR